jgi:non-haem Fe2+, alpha-ketoglutarate-dependent halogenase
VDPMPDTQIPGAAARTAANAVVPDDIRDDIRSFNENGFIGPVTLYPPDEAAALLREIRIKNQQPTSIYRNNVLNYDRHLDIPELTRHVTHPTIIKYLAAILGPDILLWRTEFFAKFPGANGTEWHQVRDYSYANGKPQLVPTETDWNAYIDLTVWTTFTPATRANGCMRFLPGTHREQIFDESKVPATGRQDRYGKPWETVFMKDTGFYGYNFSDFAIDPDWAPDPADIVDMEMDAGQAVIFTASCVHGSLPNTTERDTRFAIAARYVPTHVRVYPDQDVVHAHGVEYQLTNYGSVLVAGVNRYDHNRIRTANVLGEEFARYEVTP